jgi:predicted amidohydrolase YtcJ
MNLRLFYLLPALLPGLAVAQPPRQPVDLLVHHARLYTVNDRFAVAEAMAVKNGTIVAVGTNAQILGKFSAKNQVDAQGKPVYPGFIDAHAHFLRYGLGLTQADLVGTASWAEILEKLKSYAAAHPDGWVIGRGWDQNDWPDKAFPTNDDLNRLFPDRPVYLTRVDGHAAIVNAAALKAAGVTGSETVTGGEIKVRDGKPTGVLVDNAIGLVRRAIPEPTKQQIQNGLLAAQRNCFAVGLTTVDDCGIDAPEVDLIDEMQKAGRLKMRVYAMLSDDSLNYARFLPRGPYRTDRLTVRSFKVYGDGALGSRGACLLAAYADQPTWKGFLLHEPGHFRRVAETLAKTDFQMCTHAIGDSANRTLLTIYAAVLRGKNDRRWRIEHAQVVSEADFATFGNYNVIPSVQPTHATSDMYWAVARLGAFRVKMAYAFKRLMRQNGWIPLGTDFPVEDISPLKTFLAAVFRQDAKGYPAGGFQPENALSRPETLRGMTIWAAKSNFEEGEKGSLEVGKVADFIVLDRDLMTVPARDILKTRVLATFVGGEKVYGLP